MLNFLRSVNRMIALKAAILFLLISATSHFLYAESHEPSPPPVFRQDETQHGFSQFDTLPDIPGLRSEESPESNPTIKPSNDPDKPPGGLFYRIEFAKGFEENEGIRRGHFLVPVDSTNVFPPDTESLFLVFTVHQHYAPYQVFGRLYPEHVNGLDSATLVDEDTMHLAMEDESGYLHFSPPSDEWPEGSYRVEVFVGYEASDLNKMGTMRFSIVSSEQSS